MFGGGGDEVFAFGGVGSGEADDGEIIGFGSATGEDDFVGFGLEPGGDAVAGVIDGGASFAT